MHEASKSGNPVLDRIHENIGLAQAKIIQKDTCWSEGSGVNDVHFVTVQFPFVALRGPLGDVIINLPRAYKNFQLVSCTNLALNNSLYFHLDQLGKQGEYTALGSNAIVTDGSERWFSLKVPDSAGGTVAAQKIKLKKAVNQIYLDAGFEVGAHDWEITLACDNGDIEIGWAVAFNQL